MGKHICTRCNELKSTEDFWWNKTREKIDQPCKCCRNSQKRLRRAEMNANNRFNVSSLDKDYRLKGFDGELRKALVGKLLLERTIRRVSSPHTVSVDGAIIFICPLCDSHESIKVPIELVELVTLTNNFLKVHGDTCKKQANNPQESS